MREIELSREYVLACVRGIIVKTQKDNVAATEWHRNFWSEDFAFEGFCKHTVVNNDLRQPF